jgi:G3E family GTPase
MTRGRDGRIPLTLIGGFLGSGKTTWLRHQLHHGAMADALVIVNEAADVPVDDMLLFRSSEIRVLAGGCACCEGRERLVETLREFCDQRVDSTYQGGRFEHIVLETSGLADPGPIVDAISGDPVLMHHIRVQEIIVAVDALHGLSYLAREPLGRRQVETADRLIVTKVDAAGPEALKRLAATLRALNPSAALGASAMGSPANLPDFAGVEAEALPGEGEATDAPVLSTVLRLEDASDWTAFATWLSAVLHARGDDIIRVKGVVRTPAGRLLLQSVRRVVQAPEMLPDAVTEGKDDNCIVFIGKGFRQRDLEASLGYFTRIGTKRPSASAAP